MSACWNSGSVVMSVPVLAMSTAKMLSLLKRLAFHMTIRSHTNFHTIRQLWLNETTVIRSVCLSRTRSLALMPLFLSDSMSRLAATAAPPIRSDVLINSTLINLSFLDSLLSDSIARPYLVQKYCFCCFLFHKFLYFFSL